MHKRKVSLKKVQLNSSCCTRRNNHKKLLKVTTF